MILVVFIVVDRRDSKGRGQSELRRAGTGYLSFVRVRKTVRSFVRSSSEGQKDIE